MKDAHFMNLIEFMRPAHAEMAALCDAARRGLSVQGCTLYVTAFPCHMCSKHIIASGIHRVVYVEPYPKSLTRQLYGDSVQVDLTDGGSGKVRFEAFVGVAPRRFLDWFTMVERKEPRTGRVIAWNGTSARARLGDWAPTIDGTWSRERSVYDTLETKLQSCTEKEKENA